MTLALSKKLLVSAGSCIVIVCATLHSIANTTRNIPPQQWKSLTTDKAFDYVTQLEKTQQPVARSDAFAKFLMALISFLRSDAGLAIAWIFVGCIVLFVLYKLFGGDSSILFRKKKKKLRAATGTDADDNMDTADWQQLAEKAAQDNDMRMAIRYHYMHLLQLLQQHALIKYRSDKTNHDYANELSNTSYNQPFKKLSRQYEFIWYGHYTLSPEAYNEYTATLHQLKQQLG